MVRWKGKIAAGSTSDAVVGPIDMYPTILDALGIKTNPAQTIDGVSFLPVLMQEGKLAREAYFTWFPHIIPAVTVRKNEWKLIRRFQPHPEYPAIHELYDLKHDLGETNNLVDKMPDKVAELNKLIDEFVKSTGALYPIPNPEFKAVSTTNTKNSAINLAIDPIVGLVPKFCKIKPVEGAIKIEADGRTPFLGTTQIKSAGKIQAELVVRSSQGGSGKIRWKLAEQTEFPVDSQSVEFKLSPVETWETIKLTILPEKQLGTIRIYLPANSAGVEIASIKFTAENSGKQIKHWDFSKKSVNNK